ncbi:L-aspartate oxidase [Beggiatoa leptomitoformis]|uniref:L-aspartate oxidase n=1 Tax=Beggiatoa leptomitoformis TaxID=288004 RepID=A0A2N9YFK5_9GAMM|nr:L-aspartate oxidase [Beggiatoa leptomitoformis]AUI69165.1 L-aspartate oxidase [Beggiatoa leptomitoformis]QGX03753.1 L-aspartate oxidase [Beggiatoa leptomitoformis]
MTQQAEYDVLVIGSGAAGLSLALELADHARVAVLSKAAIDSGSTQYAQGGISVVLGEDDSLNSHVEDTLNAGAGLCDRDIVHFTVAEGPDRIAWLIKQGVPFTQESNIDGQLTYHLTREGGHSHRRVIHVDDATGKAVVTTLTAKAAAHPNIRLLERHITIDLITGKKLGLETNRCLGAYVLNRDTNEIIAMRARFVVLATGGAGKVYLYTSNPDVATGDGIAMAWRAGCRVGNMEFIQFHPTCLFHPEAKSFLISEAVRGEGGRLLLPDGTPFMHRFDPRAELAPRDIVARAIDHEMKRIGSDYVFLDITHKSEQFIVSHFPNIYHRCLELGYDMANQPIPIVPAAHYTCGGVVTDRHGHTDIAGLYCIGESAFTGLHGANRMASNSLLECLVFGHSASQDILAQLENVSAPPAVPSWDESRVTDSDEEVVVSHNWDELRRFMWDYVGIVRTTKRLERAKRRVDLLQNEIHEYYSNFRISNDLIELRNLVVVADLIIRSALLRKESRGLHYTLDYPERSPEPQNTVLVP